MFVFMKLREELRLFIQLNRCYDAVHQSIRLPRLLTSDITPTEFEILEVLLHKGELHQQEISSKILKSKGNISLVIEALAKKELIHRHRCPSDRRQVLCSLTPEGKKQIESIFPQVEAHIVQCMNNISKQEQEELSRILKKLGFAALKKACERGEQHES